MTSEAIPEPVLTTEKESVRHLEEAATDLPLLLTTTPFRIWAVVAEFCCGPVIWKARKSSRNWQMLSLHGQISVLQVPAAGASDSKWVQFSLDDSPQFRTTGKKSTI